MKLTPGILKSVESAVKVTFNDPVDHLFVIKYGDVVYTEGGKVKCFYAVKTAKKFLVQWVTNIFRQGEYWQSCAENVKQQKQYDVDFSATIAILPSYGLTKRFESIENKKMFKDLTDELLDKKIFTIEKYKI